MSLKAIELQIAIPKTFDAGKIADQNQQNIINQQINANEALKKEIERKQLAVNESENLDVVDDEEEGDTGNQQAMFSKQNKKKKAQKQPKAQHPFKGNLFDVNG